MTRTVINSIDKLDIDEAFNKPDSCLLIEINDNSAYRNGETTSDVIEIKDIELIPQILEYLKLYASEDLSPQLMFGMLDGEYLSYIIKFKKPYQEYQKAADYKKRAINELSILLNRNSFSVPYDEIIDITISHPNL